MSPFRNLPNRPGTVANVATQTTGVEPRRRRLPPGLIQQLRAEQRLEIRHQHLRLIHHRARQIKKFLLVVVVFAFVMYIIMANENMSSRTK